jgi:drug/metabolite transporter (DMT)-like permease
VGERLTWNLIIGTAMILVGLWIAEHSSAERDVTNDTITLSEAEGRRR